MSYSQQSSTRLPHITIPGTDILYTAAERRVLTLRKERVEYFQSVPWDLFTTHTVTRKVGVNTQYSLWAEYLDRVRSTHRDTIGMLWAQEEVRSDNPLHRLAPHWHCLWVSPKPLDQQFLRSQWMDLAGTSGKPIDIEGCDGNSRVIGYLLKLADHPDSHWECTPNLELLMPGGPDLSSSQARRRYARFLKRSEQSAVSTSESITQTMSH